MTNRLCAGVKRIAIRPIHCVAMDNSPHYMHSNTVRKQPRCTADCERGQRAQSPPCYLAALRDAHLQVKRLDDIASPLEVRAQRLFGDTGDTVYECSVSAGDVLLADGRITIMLRT